MTSIKNLRIGIATMGTKAWLGGVSYVELLCKAVRSLPLEEQPQELFLVFHDMTQFVLYEKIAPFTNGIIVVGEHYASLEKHLTPPSAYCPSNKELFTKIDFFYPTAMHVMLGYCAAAWIPDFQHIHLPQFFHDEQSQYRNARIQEIADDAPFTVFSSKDAEKDFVSIHPNSPTQRWVLPFYSLPLNEWYSGNPLEIQQKYKLPDKFLIVCNQFWAHKNHVRVIEALAILKSRGLSIPIVCTGATDDPRSSDFMQFITESIANFNLSDDIHILGMIPRADQIQLIRRSAGVIQPSLFEGWSTVVEDARALGKTIFLSDLAVNIEQNPRFAHYFNRESSTELADLIQRELPTLTAGPDLNRENIARTEVLTLVSEYGRSFLKLSEACVNRFNSRSA